MRYYKSFIHFDNLTLLRLWGVKMWQKVWLERPWHALSTTGGKACNWQHQVFTEKSWRIKVDGMPRFMWERRSVETLMKMNFWKIFSMLDRESIFSLLVQSNSLYGYWWKTKDRIFHSSEFSGVIYDQTDDHFIATLCNYELQAVENDAQELYIHCTTKRLWWSLLWLTFNMCYTFNIHIATDHSQPGEMN